MAALFAAQAEVALKTVNNPGGGQISYGPMGPQASVQGAMGAMLRQLHARYGDRPQLGRLFQDRSGQTLAVFFNVTARNAGGQRLAGLAIVSVPPGGQANAAVLTDDTQRFPQTVNSMLQRLSAEWGAHAESSPTRAGAAAGGAAVALRETPFPDNSGSVGLPNGWNLASARMGAMEADGPNGEKLLFGIYIPVMDPNNPQQRYMINMETQGGGVPLPGLYVAIPWGTDPGQALVSMATQLAQKQQRPAPSITIAKITDGQAAGGTVAKVIQGEVDAHDGKGVQSLTVEMHIVPPLASNAGWGMTIYQASAPKALFDRESPTMAAVAGSYRVNNPVVQHEGNSRSRQITTSPRACWRARSSQTAFDRKLAHDRANEDARDRSFQAFDNIIIGQSVVEDTYRNAHGTISDDSAEALVKANPDRFRYVPAQDYLKGIDY